MSWDFQQLQVDVQNDVGKVTSGQELEAFRLKYLGKKGLIPKIYASMGGLSKEERPVVGKNANDLRNQINQVLEDKKQEIKQKEKLHAQEDLDVTIPGVGANLGHRHVLSQTIASICQIFVQMGFVIQEGPEVETEFNNFEALNIPIEHPSRDAFDTFYVETPDPQQKGRYLLLRSQTSPGQIRTMQQYDPPFAVVIPGKVYRPDAVDASHSFMFHQIEGLYVAKDVKMSDLKGLLTVFCKKFFGNDIKMRFRPHFFPFTEPSAEVDISCYICGGKGCSVCGRKGWLEIMGCGMVHPRVFEAVNYPQGKYTGLAFGLGVERIAMLKHGIHDIRIFYENDNRFLNQF